MIVVIGQFRLPAAQMAAARPLMARVMQATRAEPGCIEYNYAEDVLDPGLIRVSEIWETREQLAAHLQTGHMRRWGEERTALGLSGRSMTAFVADSGELF